MHVEHEDQEEYKKEEDSEDDAHWVLRRQDTFYPAGN